MEYDVAYRYWSFSVQLKDVLELRWSWYFSRCFSAERMCVWSFKRRVVTRAVTTAITTTVTIVGCATQDAAGMEHSRTETSLQLCRMQWLVVFCFMVHVLLCADANRTNTGTTTTLVTLTPQSLCLVCVGRAQIGAVDTVCEHNRFCAHVVGPRGCCVRVMLPLFVVCRVCIPQASHSTKS